MKHPTRSFMPGILDSEEKRKRRSWIPLNKKSHMFFYNQRTRGWIKALQSGAMLYHQYITKNGKIAYIYSKNNNNGETETLY